MYQYLLVILKCMNLKKASNATDAYAVTTLQALYDNPPYPLLLGLAGERTFLKLILFCPCNDQLHKIEICGAVHVDENLEQFCGVLYYGVHFLLHERKYFDQCACTPQCCDNGIHRKLVKHSPNLVLCEGENTVWKYYDGQGHLCPQVELMQSLLGYENLDLRKESLERTGRFYRVGMKYISQKVP